MNIRYPIYEGVYRILTLVDTQNAVRPDIVGCAVTGGERHFPSGMAVQGKEGHPVHPDHGICFRFGCGAHHQARSQGLPAQTGTPGASAGVGGRCVPSSGYGAQEREGAVSPYKPQDSASGKVCQAGCSVRYVGNDSRCQRNR